MTYQAILTKFLAPTNSRGSRIKAIADAGTITVSADHACTIEQRHMQAAKELCAKLGWTIAEGYTDLVQGGMPQSSGYAYCFTFLPREHGNG